MKLEGQQGLKVTKQLPRCVVCQLPLPAERGFCAASTPNTFKGEKPNLVSQGCRVPYLQSVSTDEVI